MDSSKYIQFFENLTSPNKEIRQQAEKDLEQIKQLKIEQSFPIFQAGISSEEPKISQLASLMMKKVYFENKDIRSNLTNEQILNIKNFLKSQISFNSNKNWKTLQRIGDNLAYLYQLSDMKESFSEILFWFNSNEPLARKFSIYIIEFLSDLSFFKSDLVQSNLNDFKNMFIKGLNDNDIQVKVSSIKSFCGFLKNLNDDKLLEEFSELIENLLNCTLSILGNDEFSDKEILESLNNLTDFYPKFWKSKIEILIEVTVKISKEKKLSNNTRSSSLELIYSLSKIMPSKIRKSNNFINLFIPELFELIKEIDNENDINKWEKIIKEDENDLEDMFYNVKSGFERLSLNLGGKYFMETINKYIKQYLLSENWIEIHSAFMILASICEGCKEVFKDNLTELLDYISKSLINQNPRVKYSSLIFFENLIRQTSPELQRKFSNNILPGLAILLSDNEKSLKVKSQACSVLVEFLRGLLTENEQMENLEILKPYSNDLIKLLSGLFEQSLSLNYPPLQQNSLDCISLLANILEKDFEPYYQKIMPGLKKLFYNLNPENESQKELKSHCIETISYLFSSISDDNKEYMNDLKEMSEVFAKYLNNLQEDDPQLNAILNSFIHISLAMGDEFIPILDFLFPYLEKYIKNDIGLKIEDADVEEYIPDSNEENNKVGSIVVNFGTNNKKLSLNTFVLQNKINACEILNEICLNLRKSFFPYTERFLNLTKTLLKFSYSRKLRKIAIKSIYSCMDSCDNEEQKGKILSYVEKDIIGVFEFNIQSKYFREIKSYLKRFSDFCSLIEDKKYFPNDFVNKLYVILGNVVKLTQEKTKDILSLSNDDDYDENDADDQKADINKLVEINRRVMELSGILFKIFGEEITDLVKKNLGDFFLFSWKEGINYYECQNNKIPFEQYILTSICFFCDLMEYSDINTFNSFYDIFLQLSDKSKINEDCLQNIIYGYGIICKRMDKNLFKEKYKNNILLFINNTFERPRNDGNENTYDTCINALGRYIFYQGENNNDDINLSSKFINLLPLKFDKEIFKRTCKEFFEKILNNHPLIMNDVNLPLVKNAVARIIDFNKKENCLDNLITDLVMVTYSLNINNINKE